MKKDSVHAELFAEHFQYQFRQRIASYVSHYKS